LQADQNGLAAAGLQADKSLIYLGKPSLDMGRDNASQLIDAQVAMAILCGGFEISNGALSAFVQRRAPNDQGLAFIGYGDPSFYSWVSSRISTIHVPLDDLIQCAIYLVCDIAEVATQSALSYPETLMLRGP